MEISELIDEYSFGPQKLRDALTGMTPEEIDAAPVPGKWSTRQIVCHLADFEPVYADRMKHVIAEDHPTFAGGFHQQFAEHLAYGERDIEEELTMIEVTRSQMARAVTEHTTPVGRGTVARTKRIPVEQHDTTGKHCPWMQHSVKRRNTDNIPFDEVRAKS